MNKKQIAITLGIMCFILTMAIVIQIRTINNTNKVASQSLTDNDLRDQVLRWKEKYDQEYSDLQNATKRLEKVRTLASKNTEGSDEKEAELLKNNMMIGLTDVEGEGVTVTLRDDQSVTSDSLTITDSMSNHLVHDSDLISVVNELKNAGAEAISINDQRIIGNSDIFLIGSSSTPFIQVNGQRITSPYVIKAIGNKAYLESAVSISSSMLQALKEEGHGVEIQTSGYNRPVVIKAYTGTIDKKYMKDKE